MFLESFFLSNLVKHYQVKLKIIIKIRACNKNKLLEEILLIMFRVFFKDINNTKVK
jgi:hypothetical protein